mgnify:CR=1 FL=1
MAQQLTRQPPSVAATPHRAEITVVFTDLTHFRNFVEVAEPEIVVSVLREMHLLLGEIVTGLGGVVIDYVGDGVFFMFNDPTPVSDPEIRAVSAAVEIRDQFRPVSERWQRTYGTRMAMRIGVHSGFATLGMLGFPGHERYGPVGKTVVLAALCSREARDGQIIVTQRVAAAVESVAVLEPLPDMSQRLDRPVKVFNVLGLRPS